MISVNEAKALIQANAPRLASVRLPLEQAAGLVLAADVSALAGVPPFHQSAMDGYAFRYADYLRAKTFDVVGEAAAGNQTDLPFAPQGAVRIFTGAPLPAWADTVVMQEKTEMPDGRLVVKDEELVCGSNVRTEGFEIAAGETALLAGTVLTPGAIGFLAGVGTTHVTVYPKPRVHIIVTGNELQSPGVPLQAGQVYESNSVMLKTALRQLHITNIGSTAVGDDVVDLHDAIHAALDVADVILLTGGVSVGDYDYVVQSVEACGVKRLFHKVAQRPGKPLYAGTKDGKIVFGLPGNPASVLTCFYVYVAEALEALAGREKSLPQKLLPLSAEVGKKVALTQFLKAVCNESGVTPLPAQESFRLSSFAHANCLVVLPEEKNVFAKGETVETILLPCF